MPKVSLTPENKVAQQNEFPRLSLEHGERALIVCIEPEPTTEFKHVLRAPEIGPDGKVLKEERKTAKGESYDATVTEFIGQHLCFGDFATVQEKGIDPENCPTCAAAETEEGITAPVQYYAMHVIKYALQPGGWTVRDPFSVALEVWVYSPTRLNQIIDIAEEWGDLRKHDLKLGPCENKKFQKFDIQPAKDAAWLANEERKQIVSQTYKNNQCPDLSTQIARRISKGDALSDVAKVTERYAQINGRSTPVTVPDLAAHKQQKPEQNVVDMNTGEVTEPAPQVAESAPDEAQATISPMTFEDILNDL